MKKDILFAIVTQDYYGMGEENIVLYISEVDFFKEDFSLQDNYDKETLLEIIPILKDIGFSEAEESTFVLDDGIDDNIKSLVEKVLDEGFIQNDDFDAFIEDISLC